MSCNRRMDAACFAAVLALLPGCEREADPGPPVLRWYVASDPSGAFEAAAERCAEGSEGGYRIEIAPLPADADQQREQLVRRLAAGDPDIDLIGMDVIWTAEFARAGWILRWKDELAAAAKEGRLAPTVESASYRGELWAAPFTTNTQLLWYRTDRMVRAPATWDEMIEAGESIGANGRIQVQGQRYEGFTVFFVSLLASAGGTVLDETGERVALPPEPTERALRVMKRLADSSAADPSLSTMREDETRLAFENGGSSFMVNYTFIWPSARRNAPDLARHLGWARWPGVIEGRPSRVTIGGLNLAIGAFSRHPELAFRAATCIASEENQLEAASGGGLIPSSERLYESPELAAALPFAALLRESLRDGVQRPQTPVYTDVSLAIARTLHPMREIDPAADAERLRQNVDRALRSQGLL